jgi:hypothetical protein
LTIDIASEAKQSSGDYEQTMPARLLRHLTAPLAMTRY